MMTPSIFGENLFDDLFDEDFLMDDAWDRELDRRMKKLEKQEDRNPLFGKNAKNLMKTDVKELDDGYEVDVDLPGFQKDEIHVKLEDGYITIAASKGLDKDEKEKKTGKYLRKERYEGAVSRSFYVGDAYEQKDLKAKFENGILSITLPKKDQKKLDSENYIEIE